MTIASVRIYYNARDPARELGLNGSHWGFAEWFTRRLKPMREQLRGPEVKGVDIVSLTLVEDLSLARQPDRWIQRGNSFQFSVVCDLAFLEASPPL